MTDMPPNILYVDDDHALTRLVEKAAGRRGFGFVHAASAEEGLPHIDAGGIDVIVLDHYLPTGTGIDLLAALRDRRHAPPVVYVTGAADLSVAVDALKAGAVDYVPKVVSDDFLELLFSAIGQAVSSARLAAAKEAAEQEVRAARDRAELMLREVNHRVANSLSLIGALVRMQAAAISDAAAIKALGETQARIAAIGGVHRRLYTQANVGSVAIDEYLRGLVEELDVSVMSAAGSLQIKVEAAPLMLSTDKAVSLGVAVTELVTNAVKYAYGETNGEIRVRLVATEEGRAALHVEDDGVGWRGEGKPTGTGLGSKIIKAMATSLGSGLRYEAVPRGTCAIIEFSVAP